MSAPATAVEKQIPPANKDSDVPDSKIRMADVRVLEHPTLKVPYEILNKRFRMAQKAVDREVSHVQTSMTDLEKSLVKTPTTVREVRDILGNVAEKLQILKRKSEESICEELEAARVCKRRTEHLKDYNTTTRSEINHWKKTRLDRLLVDHFLRSGYYQTAMKLAQHSKIEDLTNIEVFLVAREVEDSLISRETAKCLSWCHDNRSKLRKLRSTLEINLRQQEFIEMIKQDQKLDAVKHARKFFGNLEDYQLEEVQRCMALLAFPIDTDIKPYAELFSEARWDALVEQFRQENFKLYQLSPQSVFHVGLQAGLSAMKTPHCFRKDHKNQDCPVCQSPMNELANPLPFSHCSQSRLICHVSGKPLNEHNAPMMLPNGYVYGEAALALMADEDEKIVCPRTKEIFQLKEAEKVFVM